MRTFVIADASKRKARPIALLLWQPDDDGGQGIFTLQVSGKCSERDLPLSLSFCMQREGRCATHEESEQWVRSRIVPESRHNITEVLMANGLSKYDEAGLLATCKGRSSDDDYLVYEVKLPSGMEEGLLAGDFAADDSSEGSVSRADKVIDAVVRQRRGAEVRYSFLDLEVELETSKSDAGINGNVGFSVDDCNNDSGKGGVNGIEPNNSDLNAAQRIGAQIRSQRLEAGLTQKQLAIRAGIAQAVISRVESGSGNPTLSLLEELAAAMGMKLDVALRDL